jgi:hypothetical protein
MHDKTSMAPKNNIKNTGIKLKTALEGNYG